MTTPADLEENRNRVFAALKWAGYPVDQWQREYEQELAANPTAKPRPFTTITPPIYGKIQKLRPGFDEFISHPYHGKPVPRCQAARKRTGGKVQCGKFAIKGKHLCRMHGGAAGSGKISEQGRKNQLASVTVHGSETIQKRKDRKEKSHERRELAKIAVESGMAKSTGLPRGRYYKPSRKN